MLLFFRKSTTHIIAQNLAGVKLQNLKPHQKVVQPLWITDCLKANTLLPIQPYLLAVPTSYNGQQLLSSLYSDKPSSNFNFSTFIHEFIIKYFPASKNIVEETEEEEKTSINLKDSKNVILSTPEKLNR